MIEHRLEKANLRIRPGVDFDIVNPESDERYRECWTAYHKLMSRRGITPAIANLIRTGAMHGEWYVTAPYTQVPDAGRWSLTLLYLVAPSSEFVTGTVIKVDDGQGPR